MVPSRQWITKYGCLAFPLGSRANGPRCDVDPRRSVTTLKRFEHMPVPRRARSHVENSGDTRVLRGYRYRTSNVMHPLIDRQGPCRIPGGRQAYMPAWKLVSRVRSVIDP